MDELEGVGKKECDQCVPQMRLLRKIAYGEFSEFVQEKKVHITYIGFFLSLYKNLTVKC